MNVRRSREPRAVSLVVLGIAVALAASNLRPAVASVGPLLHRIELGDGVSNTGASVLTTLPILCYAIVAPAAAVLARRLGFHATVAAALALLLAGQLIRLLTGAGFLFLGTAIAGAAIAIGNVLMPVMVRRDFPQNSGVAMSVFSTTMMGFAALAAGVSVPVANALGGGWRPGLGIWVIPAAVAVLAWSPALLRRRPESDDAADSRLPTEPRARDIRLLLRDPLAWQVTLFFAVQSGGFYATLAWLPSIFRSHGFSDAHAGVMLSVNLVVGTFTGLVVPALAHRFRDQRGLVAGSCILAAIGWLGILLAPTSASYLWVIVMGLGQNAAFPLVMMLIVLRGGSVRTTHALSGMAQTVGYGLAALAPLAIGALHGATHSWTPELILLLALLVPQLLLGLGAGRAREVSTPVPSQPITPGLP